MTDVVRAVLDLPASLLREIGRVITAHSVVELYLNNIVYDLIGLDPTIGRLAVREPRAADRVDLIAKLMTLKGFTTTIDMKELRKTIDKCTTERDQLAHGVWGPNPRTGVLHLRLVRGTQEIEKGRHVSRIISPVGLPLTADDCAAIRRRIREVIVLLSRLHGEIRAAPPPKSA
jgi:hypothetical protein